MSKEDKNKKLAKNHSIGTIKDTTLQEIIIQKTEKKITTDKTISEIKWQNPTLKEN